MSSITALNCAVQHYAWGKHGASSAVAQLLQGQGGSVIDETKPYAELWMGTHKNGPSRVGDTLLSEWIEANEPTKVMGDAVTARWPGSGGNLPYLLKVLSVNKALSIQAHPDKSLAERLHAERPDVYKDPNHKPELACAITRFEVLCSFRAAGEIEGFLKTVPELRSTLGDARCDDFSKAVAGGDADCLKTSLRALFTALMTSDADQVRGRVESLVARLQALSESERSPLENLVLRIQTQFPGDVGIFCVFLLNHLILEPGEAIFLSANEPHAYLDGNCVECMACSDNVVRAGLTPKFKDVDNLCAMLTYKTGPPVVLKGCMTNEAYKDVDGTHIRSYVPPIDDFCVDRVGVVPGGVVVLPPSASPSIILCQQGSGVCTQGDARVELVAGVVVFAPAGVDVSVQCLDTSDAMVLFRAAANV